MFVIRNQLPKEIMFPLICRRGDVNKTFYHLFSKCFHCSTPLIITSNDRLKITCRCGCNCRRVIISCIIIIFIQIVAIPSNVVVFPNWRYSVRGRGDSVLLWIEKHSVGQCHSSKCDILVHFLRLLFCAQSCAAL